MYGGGSHYQYWNVCDKMYDAYMLNLIILFSLLIWISYIDYLRNKKRLTREHDFIVMGIPTIIIYMLLVLFIGKEQHTFYIDEISFNFLIGGVTGLCIAFFIKEVWKRKKSN